jgi:hypothetical protein
VVALTGKTWFLSMGYRGSAGGELSGLRKARAESLGCKCCSSVVLRRYEGLVSMDFLDNDNEEGLSSLYPSALSPPGVLFDSKPLASRIHRR